ncbi:Os02g0620000 [Oryza sativa Japonica Group]|uniref:Os02g0620000 protein n=1 Tax=Oryza sativa subsp. japonica TaxID=39947 RepID=A0A0P0VLT3_ORYSJ|nr:Os02g0620000 [Oryza sativa Japonica Group]
MAPHGPPLHHARSSLAAGHAGPPPRRIEGDGAELHGVVRGIGARLRGHHPHPLPPRLSHCGRCRQGDADVGFPAPPPWPCFLTTAAAPSGRCRRRPPRASPPPPGRRRRWPPCASAVLPHCGGRRQQGDADAGLPAPCCHRLGDADAGLPAPPPCFPTTAAAPSGRDRRRPPSASPPPPGRRRRRPPRASPPPPGRDRRRPPSASPPPPGRRRRRPPRASAMLPHYGHRRRRCGAALLLSRCPG